MPVLYTLKQLIPDDIKNNNYTEINICTFQLNNTHFFLLNLNSCILLKQSLKISFNFFKNSQIYKNKRYMASQFRKATKEKIYSFKCRFPLIVIY